MKDKKIRINHNAGDTYNRWTLIYFSKWCGTAQIWMCRCLCGTEKYVRINDLRTNKNKSCGCLAIQTNTTHNESSRNKRTKEYSTWSGIKARCLDPRNKAYKNYGGRGILVCDRWKDSYENFLSDVGRAPTPEHSIDRFPNLNGNYEPSNVRWATRLEQNNNKRNTIFVSVNGERMCLADGCRLVNVKYASVFKKIDRGMSPQNALDFIMQRQKGGDR